ncbi:hypothetical protein D8I35_15470 [Corticibacter populi]|uniref:Uncharacterized protein n=1 Tax=Corticibacter populi TaxID=1550736 RepID=A0A3M6QNV4_9BURK|nr:ribonuclease domain-containing protein [Corticibacter populi]RMX04199.1 hypothetical protein D8I35_15470 [Corticibacter populi]RZS33226.1 ribonuclease T1 [Corticibacter populi]
MPAPDAPRLGRGGALRRIGAAVLLGAAALGSATPALSAWPLAATLLPAEAVRDHRAGGAAGRTVELRQLPAQARHTYQLILQGGPFPYEKDGSIFGNRERLLPAQPRGHYREYTVPTPRARDRGARRIVCGGTPPTRPAACYYTADHYTSFRLIVAPTAQP